MCRAARRQTPDWLRLILDEPTGAVVWASGGGDDHDHDRN
jgi:hypothetical protein